MAEYSVLQAAKNCFYFGDTCRTVCAIALHRKTKTNTNPDPSRYRRCCPDPNVRIQKFIHYMTTTPQWVVLQNSMRVELAHTHLHTTRGLKLSFLIMRIVAKSIICEDTQLRNELVNNHICINNLTV